MKITEYLKERILYLDGGLGTLLQSCGLRPGELPESWNIIHPDIVKEIHRKYFDAGSNVVAANTFGANSLKFSHGELEKIICSAMDNVRAAAESSASTGEKWVALDVGPIGRMLAPYGDLDFEDAVRTFSEIVRLGAKYGADLIFIETMNDSFETKAALLAAKESCDLPVFVSNAYGEDGKLMTGASPAAMVALLEGMGADAIGVNCSLGPKALRGVVEEYLKYSSVPVILKPNAGLPRAVGERTVYDVGPDEFAEDVSNMIAEGVRIAGGCCGTDPGYISELVKRSRNVKPIPLTQKKDTLVSSYTHAVRFGEKPILIGERINPTGKKRFKEALKTGDVGYILKEGIEQQETGADILDVNVGLPEIDERRMLERVVCELQAVVDLPLQIDSSDPVAMEAALRHYNGKAMINSVNGKRESMEAVFPLARKYGGLVVALTLDECGIPQTAEERLEIAKKIVSEASKYGIERKDLIFDSLALTVSADSMAAVETLRAVELIKKELGCHTSLGISNVSFGLPMREAVNSTFFTLALGRGLSAAIMNPYSSEMMKSYYSFCALSGLDENCADYIAYASSLPKEAHSVFSPHRDELPKGESASEIGSTASDVSELQMAIIKGLREQAASLTGEMLCRVPYLDVIEKEIIPALNTVGVGFENKTVYLPQLLMSAEAAKASFECIKSTVPSGKTAGKCPVVIATVKGDIHDIGKNIVKLLLENFGFAVSDMGRDVPPENIVEETVKLHAPIVGLSALMTTTVPAMAETIAALRKSAPWCRVVVGGAVLNQEYADEIGADKYSKDAMETVRYAEEINKEIMSL